MFISPLFSDSQQHRGVFGVIFPLGNPALAGYEVNTSRSGAKRNTAKNLADWQRLWKGHSMKPILQISGVLEHWNENKRLL